MRGSEHNDALHIQQHKIRSKTNHAGGIVGGISNGEMIYFRVAFKPVATIAKTQETITLQNETVALTASGRHDPCVLPRAIPIVDAMAALVIIDHYLRHKAQNLPG
jgi:chorismate synthase